MLYYVTDLLCVYFICQARGGTTLFRERYLALSNLLHTIKQSTLTILVSFLTYYKKLTYFILSYYKIFRIFKFNNIKKKLMILIAIFILL